MALSWPTFVGVTMIVTWRELNASRSPAQLHVSTPPLGPEQVPPEFGVAETKVTGEGSKFLAIAKN